MVRSGANFFRDPRALDGVERGLRPVCDGCEGAGMVLDARFCELVPGREDVLLVEDHVEWGVSVAFVCGCCWEGFSWV